jgi:quercetin dioxygenase-like cupin family protein
MITPYVLQSGEGLPNSGSDVKASGASTGGVLTLIESRTTGGAPLHVHTREDEYFYVVEGTITVQVGDDHYEAGPRSFVFLPRGIPHAWDVVGSEATLLLMTIPAGLDTFLDEYHAAATREERDQVAARYGITFL